MHKLLATFAAQNFAKMVCKNGPSVLAQAFMGKPDMHHAFMASEIIASSRGHGLEGLWSYFASKWLFETKFVASEELTDLARAWVKRDDSNDLIDLANRLSKRPKELPRKNPEITMTEAKRIAKACGNGEMGIRDRGISGVFPTCNEAVQLLHCRKISDASLGFIDYTNMEMVEAARVFLSGVSDKFHSLDIGYAHHIDRLRGPYDPARVLWNCRDLFPSMPPLKYFLSTDLFFDDSLVEAVTSSFGAVLEGFRAWTQYPKDIDCIDISPKAIDFLLECPNLKMVDITSRHLTKNDRKRLTAKFPRLTLLGLPKR